MMCHFSKCSCLYVKKGNKSQAVKLAFLPDTYTFLNPQKYPSTVHMVYWQITYLDPLSLYFIGINLLFVIFGCNVIAELCYGLNHRFYSVFYFLATIPLLATLTSLSNARCSCKSTSTWCRSWRRRRWLPISSAHSLKTRTQRSKGSRLRSKSIGIKK